MLFNVKRYIETTDTQSFCSRLKRSTFYFHRSKAIDSKKSLSLCVTSEIRWVYLDCAVFSIKLRPQQIMLFTDTFPAPCDSNIMFIQPFVPSWVGCTRWHAHVGNSEYDCIVTGTVGRANSDVWVMYSINRIKTP